MADLVVFYKRIKTGAHEQLVGPVAEGRVGEEVRSLHTRSCCTASKYVFSHPEASHTHSGDS